MVCAWATADVSGMTPETLTPLLHHAPMLEIVLIGTGKSMLAIPQDIRMAFRAEGIGLDVMDTGAACRTYHVLLAEKRRVGVALLPIP